MSNNLPQAILKKPAQQKQEKLDIDPELDKVFDEEARELARLIVELYKEWKGGTWKKQ